MKFFRLLARGCRSPNSNFIGMTGLHSSSSHHPHPAHNSHLLDLMQGLSAVSYIPLLPCSSTVCNHYRSKWMDCPVKG